MTNQEALEKLELEVGASQQGIKQQYQEFYNEFQMLSTNAQPLTKKHVRKLEIM
jgi:DnaJ-domain-containing protein 1